MKNIIILIIFLASVLRLNAQKDLVGLVDNHLVRIDSLTGEVGIYKTIENLSANPSIKNLTYSTKDSVFYGIRNWSSAPSLISISLDAEYKFISRLTHRGRNVEFAEALAYDSVTDALFGTISIDGIERLSEVYVEIDKRTGRCTVLAEVPFNSSKKDGDNMAFFDGKLLSVDNDGVLRFYRLYESEGAYQINDFRGLFAMNSLISNRDITATQRFIYIPSPEGLYVFNRQNEQFGFRTSFTFLDGLSQSAIWGISQAVLPEKSDPGPDPDPDPEDSCPDLELAPNVMTPNGDGLNEYFIIDESLFGSDLQVYNRWGRLVYESYFYKNDWDGGNLEPGIYYYTLFNNCGESFDGWVQIIK